MLVVWVDRIGFCGGGGGGRKLSASVYLSELLASSGPSQGYIMLKEAQGAHHGVILGSQTPQLVCFILLTFQSLFIFMFVLYI